MTKTRWSEARHGIKQRPLQGENKRLGKGLSETQIRARKEERNDRHITRPNLKE